MEKRQGNTYVQVLFANMETCRREGWVMPFHIVAMIRNGFRVKVGGLFAFVLFKIMPWQYKEKKAWESVFPYLLDKHFFCKIDRIETDPPRLFLDPSVHRFQPAPFEEGQAYEGLVLNRTDYGVFLDLGFHDRWRCGSHVALFHISAIEKRGLQLHSIQPGDRLTVTYFGITPAGHIQLETPFNLPRPRPDLDPLFVGQVLPVQVIKDSDSGEKQLRRGRWLRGPDARHQTPVRGRSRHEKGNPGSPAPTARRLHHPLRGDGHQLQTERRAAAALGGERHCWTSQNAHSTGNVIGPGFRGKLPPGR